MDRSRETGLGAAMFGLALAAALFAGSVRADPYLGIRALESLQKPNGTAHNCDYPNYVSCNHTFSTLNLYGGYSFGNLSLEVGGGRLGCRSAHNVSQTYNITQDITTKHIYAAALYRFDFGKLSPHVLIGVDRVSMKNHEYGSNEAGPNVDQLNYSTATVPMIGVGFTYPIGWAQLRADIFRVKNVALSHWTGSSDVLTFSAGLQVSL